MESPPGTHTVFADGHRPHTRASACACPILWGVICVATIQFLHFPLKFSASNWKKSWKAFMFPNCFPFWHSAFWLLVLLSFRAAQARNETPRGTEVVLGYSPSWPGQQRIEAASGMCTRLPQTWWPFSSPRFFLGCGAWIPARRMAFPRFSVAVQLPFWGCSAAVLIILP